MATERTHGIEELFHAALEKPPGERKRFIAESCAGDAAAAAEVESLITVHDRVPERFLERTARAAATTASAAGSDIGPYHLTREIATGGMGTIYLAHRADGAYEKQVAFKLIKRDLIVGGAAHAGELARRFLEERQCLADLEHPHIARLLDGGTADDGSPYLVMEYVDGLPIDRYCAEHSLTTAERLKLFRLVCLAVQFVHGKLIAHRDLKPSNILVEPPSEPGGDPVPKLLDFGIAKLLEPATPMSALATTAGIQRLTPAYASPEQFRREPVTTATDVYSLGVILYEVLVGRLPYDLERAMPHEVAHTICEQSPIKPSAISPKLRGDLETILLKALEKTPSRRYQTAAALAEDIERYLTGNPILARPSSAAYRLAKTVTRNKIASAIAAAFVASVTGLGAWMIVLFARAVESEKLAEQRRETAEIARKDAERSGAEGKANAALMQELFASSGPYERFGKDVKVVQVLDDAVQRLDAAPVEPLTKAALQATLGWTYSGLGQFDQALPLLDGALAKREELLGLEHEDTIASRNDLAMLRQWRHELDEAEALHRQNLEIERRVGGLDVRLATTLNNFASLLQFKGDLSGAEPLFREALAIRRRLHGDDHAETILLEQNIVLLLVHRRRLDEAEPLARKVLEARKRSSAPDAASVAEATRLLGQVLREAGRFDEAEPLLREALDEIRALFGDEHTWTLSTMVELGALLRDRRAYDESAALLIQALDVYRRVHGADDLRTATAAAQLGLLYKAAGRTDESVALCREIVESMGRAMGAENPNTVIAVLNLADALEVQGDMLEAGEWFAKAARTAEASLSPDDQLTRHAQTVYGAHLLKAQRVEEAERQLLRSYEACRAHLGAAHAETLRALDLLIALYTQSGRPDAATQLRSEQQSAASSAERTKQDP